MKNLYSQVRQIELEKREELIAKICQSRKPSKPSFSSVMHKLAEKEDNSAFIGQSIDFVIDSYMESDLASENLAEMFG